MTSVNTGLKSNYDSITGTSKQSNNSKMTWQMEVLMEKLRSKACSLRSIPDSAKIIKQCVLNKQHILDPGEKQALGQCLDKLQQNIKVTSLSAMVERLEATAKQLGLTFTAGTNGPEVYISCDMFYVEVHLQNEGKARDVKVELAGDQNEQKGHVNSSPELVDCLNKGNFSDFMAHLEGFLSIYQLNTEKKYKCKAYQALQALETDLLKLYEMAQDTLGDTHRLILKSPVGLLMKRKGGHSVKIIYFNSPYELLDIDTQRSISLTYENASTRDFAHSVSVAIEASNSHKLQTTPLVNSKEGSDGLTLPSISGLSTTNSVSLPACFCLRLKKPMAMSLTLAKKISDVTGIVCYEPLSKEPLLPLIMKQTEIQVANKGLFVTLPDQQHCYFLSSANEFEGVLVTRVPFTHPTSVAHILEFLRIQAVFNSLITSCVRPKSKQGLESAFIFEVTAVSHEHISITFEHPQEESTATAELDLTDFTNAKCRLYTLSKDTSLCSDEYATKVLQRCLSIPITMRAVMRKMIKEDKEVALPQGETVVKMETNSMGDSNQNTKFILSEYNNFGVKREQLTVTSHHNNNNNNVNNVTTTKTLTDQSPLFCSTITEHLPGTTSATNTNLFETPISVPISGQKNQFQQHHFLADGRMAKVRKRKSTLEIGGKSPKVSEEILIEFNDKSSSTDSFDAVTMRRDIKIEKVTNVKRRSSTDNLSDAENCDLAALRDKVYGAGSAANFAKFNFPTSKESAKESSKDSLKKQLKKQKSESTVESNRKSPIVLDLTENIKKSSSSHSVSLSAALLKRPGIEIIPISGSTSAISIPSSITVTPVIKTSDDKFKDKREKQRKDVKDKKRRREDSPNSSPASSNKPSKVQIISTGSNLKHSSLTSLDSLKGDSGKSSSTNTKPNTPPFQSPIKKSLSLSPNVSKPMVQSKVTFSPSRKSNKLIYSPNSKNITSPKQQCVSPKNANLSPKHSSLGKPSLNALKSNSPTFSKPSLSPKLNKGVKEKSSSPSRPPTSLGIGSSLSKSKLISTSDKLKSSFADALTITKVPAGERVSSMALSSSSTCNSSMMDKLSLEKAKASPPKNRKGSSLSDIVDKLRAGAGASGLPDPKDIKLKDRKQVAEMGQKKDGENNFTIKPSTGLKFTINKAKNGGNVIKSGLKPGVLSGPASKKISSLPTIPKLPSTSSLPPIPKLSPASISSVTATAISPLGITLPTHSSPLSYGRAERPSVKEQRFSKPINKESNVGSKLHQEMKKDLSKSKEISLLIKPQAADALDKALKDMFGDDDSPPKTIDVIKQDMNRALSIPAKSSVTDREADKKDVSVILPATAMAPPSIPKEEPQKENVPVSAGFHPSSPAVSIKIVKSPVPSPLNLISQQSVSSPCIIDDDLMDEALMGTRK